MIIRIVAVESFGCCLWVNNYAVRGNWNGQGLLGQIIAIECGERSKLNQEFKAGFEKTHFEWDTLYITSV